ncbi:MAG TPA: hypothetical protein VME68_19410 [Acidobacteriaceae bacterium]|nr:hypothetical protein [Acidobacteriaceae bacterium]
MKRMIPGSASLIAVAALFAPALTAHAQAAQTKYPNMAPVEQYLMPDRNAEIALARTAAPPSISGDAQILVLGRDGYEVAVQGTNDFVCLVERGWAAAIGDPVFWNPKNRSPICLNGAAARSYLPISMLKARLALAGQSQAQIGKALQAAFDEKKLPAIEPGAMSYMQSKEGYLNDAVGHWHPHVMFFEPLDMAKTWGANLKDSPILSGDDVTARITIFMIPVARWSDGTPDANAGN